MTLRFAPYKTRGTESVCDPCLLVHLARLCSSRNLAGWLLLEALYEDGQTLHSEQDPHGDAINGSGQGPDGDAVGLWKLLHSSRRGGCPLWGVWRHA